MARKRGAVRRGATKAQIEALSSEQVDDYVGELVMQWGRASSVAVEGGAFVVRPAWTANSGNTTSTRRDGTTYSAPNFVVYSEGATPKFHEPAWQERIIQKMNKRGFRLELEQSVDSTSAWFYPVGPRGTPNPIVHADQGEAVKRAALLAVQ
jgi:hypothetical protein